MTRKYKVITLCGSTKFKKEFQEIQKKLTLEGNIVISVGLFGHSGDNEVWENQDENTLTKTKKMLDDMHKRKIDMSDEIFVIDVGGYIGESTKSEKDYANNQNKPVRYYSQEVASDKEGYAFQKLTPTISADLTTYDDALDFVFDKENGDIQNIALTGIYGSGKSSVINTYEKQHNKRFIHISLSHFDEVEDEEAEEILEKKIVNQLVQQVPEKIIPDTRFKVKKEFCWWLALWQAFRVVLLFVLAMYISNYEKLVDSIAAGKYSEIQILGTMPAVIIATVLFVLILTSLGVQIIRWQKRNHVISKIAINGNEMEFSDNKDDKSYFNRHIDEILYVLEKIITYEKDRFDGVVIEDLDRFDKKVDTKIFEKLRELCVLGNERIDRNSSGKHQTLRFFYLLSDDTFLSKERTKFFDYIIPIIPVVDSSNAYAKIKECLESAGYYGKMDDRFLRGLSLYFDDYRLIKNVINEFQIYAKKLSNTEHDYNKLLAVIVYKNYFPKDFSRLQLHEGYVFSLFEKRDSLVKGATTELEKKKTALKERLTAISNEFLANERELQTVANDRSYYGHFYKDKNYSEWSQVERPKREQAILDRKEHNEGIIRKQIVDVQTEIIHINNKRFCDLIASLNEVEVFTVDEELPKEDGDKAVQRDKYFEVIKYLIRSGYFDDSTYRDYIACFDENGMSIEDKNFLIAVNNRRGKKFDYRLDNLQLVHDNLVSDDFLLPSIRNFSLTDFILRSGKAESFEAFVLQLKENSDLEFIGQYLRSTSCYSKFIIEICKLWDGFLEAVISDENQEMSLEERQETVITALYECSLDVIQKQNESEALTRYLSESIIDASCKDDEVEKVAEQITNLEVKINNLDSAVASKVLRSAVIDNNSYEITFDNLISLLQKDFSCSKEEIDNQFLSLLVNCENEKVSDYVKDNLSETIKLIVENFDKQEDSQETVVMVATSGIKDELITEYLELSETVLDELSVINAKFWGTLAEKHTFAESASNVLQFFEKNKLSGQLIVFLNEVEVQTNIDYASDPDRSATFWLEAYKNNELSDKVYLYLAETIGKVLSNFTISNIDELKVKILIEHDLIAMNTNSINTFRNYYKNLLLTFICSQVDTYISIVQGPMYSIDEVESLLDEEYVTEEQKMKLLNMTAEPISVQERNLSDIVFKDILTNHFDANDLQYLAIEFETYNDECKNSIYRKIVAHRAEFPEIAPVSSEKLLRRFFSDDAITLSDKVVILDSLLKAKVQDSLIGTLLNDAGEEMLARLFSQERSRMSQITNDVGHKQLLKVLKENKVIDDFSEEDDGTQLRIKR